MITTAAFVLLALIVPLFAPNTASAIGTSASSHQAAFALQADPCSGQALPDFAIQNEADLNRAITCFNSGTLGAGNYVFKLARDIYIRTEQGSIDSIATPIDQPRPGYALTIDGNRNFFDAPDMSDTSAPSLFTMTERNQASVAFVNAMFALPFDGIDLESFIWNQSPAELSIRGTTFLDELGVLDHAIESEGGPLTVQDSLFFLGDLGISAKRSDVVIDGSSFVRGETPSSFAYGVLVEGGSLNISSSTFDETQLGAVGVTGSIRNTTVSGPGLVGNPSLTVTSSIISQCGGALLNGGNNVGGCFGTEVELGRALDNGCPLVKAVRCPWTIPIDAQSPANGAGDCTGVTTDQRGVFRSPAGLGCDAGSFEYTQTDTGDPNNSGTVDNADVQALLTTLSGGSPPVDISAGDITGDGLVRLDDVLALAQAVAGN